MAAVEAVKKAERPLIFAGGGVISSDTAADVQKLAKKLGWNAVFAPALTSPGLYGNAVLSRHPLERIEVIQLTGH